MAASILISYVYFPCVVSREKYDASGGTAKKISAMGIPVTEVSSCTNFPEMLDGRVKTLHPKLHGGILAKRNKDHLAQLDKAGIGTIDLVVVNLYPFEKVAAKPGVTPEEARGNIDIGGPTMIMAAAKNWPSAAAVVRPMDYNKVLERIMEERVKTIKERLLHMWRYL